MVKWSSKTVIKYSLLQLPALALVVVGLLLVQDWVALPPVLFWSLVGFWIAKDVILFPFVWRSYDSDLQASDSSALVGKVGVTRERLAPEGYIRIRGVLWRAEVAEGRAPIAAGKLVRVEEHHGLTAIVVPEEEVYATTAAREA